jgi:hypothetical protein
VHPALARSFVVVALLGTAVTAVPGRAAGSCRPFVVDPAGDATLEDPTSGSQLVAVGNDPALDLVSADVASDRRSFSVVVRTSADMRTAQSQSGHSVELVFQAIGEHRWNAGATFQVVGPLLARLSEASSSTSTASAAGDATLSDDGRTLRLRFSTDAFADGAGRALRAGDRISHVRLYSNRALAAESSGVFSPAPADTAATSSTYRAGAHACIAP